MTPGVSEANCCPISLEPYDELRKNRTLVCTPCSHLFRDIDLYQWLVIQETCPSCRKIVYLGDVRYGDKPKETLLKKISKVFFSIIGGFRCLFEGVGKALMETFSTSPGIVNLEANIEAGRVNNPF
jgi:hypothetical protein